MFRDSLIRTLNKYQFIQFIFVIVPVLIAIIYGYAYMTDMLSIARNLEVNNRISEQAWGRNELQEVSYIEDDNGTTRAVISGDFEDEVTVGVDDVIFYVQMYDPSWYQFVTASGESVFMEQCDLFDVEWAGDTVGTVTHDDFSHDFEFGDLVCAVSVSEDGLWRVTFLLDDMPHYDLEELYMLELVRADGGSYTVKVTASYTFEIDDMEVNFCTNLPSDSLYYNEAVGSFVRNVSKDYAVTFMLRANFGIVVLSELLYCLLLWQASKEKKLELLDNSYLLRADYFAASLVVLFAPLTLIML